MPARKTLIGLISLSLMTISACSSTPVKTETVTVHVPTYIQLPADLTQPVPVPSVDVQTNGDLAEYALKVRQALDEANRRLEAIREIHP